MQPGSQIPPNWGYGPPYGVPGGYVILAQPPPPPRPRGIPTRLPFLLGASGHFFSAAMAIAFGIAVLFLPFWCYYCDQNPWLTAVIATVFFVALVLHTFGLFGFWKNYGSAMGAAAWAFGVIASVVFLLANVLQVIAIERSCPYPGYCYERTASWAVYLLIVGYVVIGVMFILNGVAFIVARRFTPLPGPAVAAGVLLIVGGSLVCSVLLALLGGFFVLVPGLIIGGIVLVKAPVPVPMDSLQRFVPPA